VGLVLVLKTLEILKPKNNEIYARCPKSQGLRVAIPFPYIPSKFNLQQHTILHLDLESSGRYNLQLCTKQHFEGALTKSSNLDVVRDPFSSNAFKFLFVWSNHVLWVNEGNVIVSPNYEMDFAFGTEDFHAIDMFKHTNVV
jgi:hypothetical protein